MLTGTPEKGLPLYSTIAVYQSAICDGVFGGETPGVDLKLSSFNRLQMPETIEWE
jgi:hypothetical protein